MPAVFEFIQQTPLKKKYDGKKTEMTPLDRSVSVWHIHAEKNTVPISSTQSWCKKTLILIFKELSYWKCLKLSTIWILKTINYKILNCLFWKYSVYKAHRKHGVNALDQQVVIETYKINVIYIYLVYSILVYNSCFPYNMPATFLLY